MTSGRRPILLVAGGVLLWYVCTLLFWALQPLSDTVPVGVDYNVAERRRVSITVECNTVFSGDARDGSPLPALAPQPGTAPPLAFPRDPCVRVHSQARRLLVFDTAVAAVLLGAAVALWRRGRSRGAEIPIGDGVGPEPRPMSAVAPS
jgi:hypothetical protein